VSGGYRWNADEYARSSSAQLGWALELIDTLGLRGDESVLDIGCGDGKVTAELARRVPRGSVTGVDSSRDMIRCARAAWPAALHPGLTFQIADARSLRFDNRFDVAFSNAALHWVNDQRAVLTGVARALRPSGRLLFQMGGRGNGAGIFSVAAELVDSPAWRSCFRGFPFPWCFSGPDEYGPWCAEAGLRAIRIELLPRTMRQNGAEGLAAWIRTTWMPYTARVPEARRESFISEVVNLYLSRHPLAEGRAAVDMVRLEVEAVKD
jgi:trans-aconitate methyltransferase